MSTAVKSSKKSAKSETVAAPVAAAVAAPAAAAAPAKEAKAPKAKAAKVEAAAPAAAAVAATPAVEAPAAAPAPAAEEDVSAALTKSIAELHEQLSTLKSAIVAASSSLKTIEKQAARVVKKADRKRKRKVEAVEGAPPKPCVFTTPTKISEELCSFLGKPKGTEISRSAVTKAVMAYAHSHSLMEKQKIKVDAPLRKLLTVTEADNVTILNLQKYLNRHYVKATPVAN